MTPEQLQSLIRAMDNVKPRLTRKGRRSLVRIAKSLKRELGHHLAMRQDNIFRTSAVRRKLWQVKKLMWKLDQGEPVDMLGFMASFHIENQLSQKSFARRIFGP